MYSNSLPNDLSANPFRGVGTGGDSVGPFVLDLGGIRDDTEEGGRRVRYSLVEEVLCEASSSSAGGSRESLSSVSLATSWSSLEGGRGSATGCGVRGRMWCEGEGVDVGGGWNVCMKTAVEVPVYT